jgi:hypothetical protein
MMEWRAMAVCKYLEARACRRSLSEVKELEVGCNVVGELRTPAAVAAMESGVETVMRSLVAAEQ